MAKSPKNKSNSSDVTDDLIDATDTTTQADATDAMGDVEADLDLPEDSLLGDEVQPEIEDAEVVEDHTLEDAKPDAEELDDMAAMNGEAPEPVADAPAASVQNTSSNSNGRFFPMLLGGIAAGGIGYLIATYTNQDTVSPQIADLPGQLEALETQVANLPDTPDLSPVEARIDEVGAQIGQMSDDMMAQIEALDARLTDVEKRPGADGTLSDTAIAAYQAELDELRAEIDAQKNDVMSAAAQAEQDLAAAREEAARLEDEARAAVEAAAARAALNRVATALETGAPFADALGDLPGEVPAALTAASDGVATTADLTDDFPALARAALATARSEGLSDDAGGLSGFLRSQFDVRSTTPQEGSGPDAVLSRAEAAVKEGRTSDAIAELDALPEVARAEMTDWLARAQLRADALDAVAALSETYN